MTVQFSVPLRDAQANQMESTLGAAPILEIRTGTKPANCAAANTGTLLLQQALPSDWLTASSNGVVSKNGTWALTSLPGITEATAGHFRIFSAGSPSVCHVQGDCGATSSGADMELDDVTIAASQSVTVNSFTYTRGNA